MLITWPLHCKHKMSRSVTLYSIAHRCWMAWEKNYRAGRVSLCMGIICYYLPFVHLNGESTYEVFTSKQTHKRWPILLLLSQMYMSYSLFALKNYFMIGWGVLSGLVATQAHSTNQLSSSSYSCPPDPGLYRVRHVIIHDTLQGHCSAFAAMVRDPSNASRPWSLWLGNTPPLPRIS